MPKIVDADIRKNALDPEQSFIVQAPAGSGKTELLIQRFLRLLPLVNDPEQILAMTFTRKAAGEMKTRIIKALTRGEDDNKPESDHEILTWNLARKALQHDKEKGWRLLENPTRLKIQTIDSFCSGLNKQTPLLSGMGASLSVEEKADESYRETAQKILELVESDGPIGEHARKVLTRLDNSKSAFLKRIVQLLHKRDQWMIPFFEKQENIQDERPYFEKTLAGIIQSVLVEAGKIIPNYLREKLPRYAAYSADNLTIDDPDHPSACLKDLSAFPEPNIGELNKWQAIASLMLKADGDIRNSVNARQGFPPGNGNEKQMKDEFVDLLDSCRENENLRKILEEISRLPESQFTDEEWSFLESMFNLLAHLAGSLRSVFSEKGKTDFTEISLAAINALGHELAPSDLLLKLDMKLQHILVDEYQDTSFKQRRLLQLLTEGWEQDDGRSLFIVGDPMQSIYRFRDAEVGLFLLTREEGVGNVLLNRLDLKTNFRSQKNVVEWFNKCFAAIFPELDDPDKGAISFSKSNAHKSSSSEDGVVLHPVIDHKSDEESEEVLSVISKIQADSPKASIAILVKARPHLKKIVKQLQDAGVSFRSEKIDPLTQRPEILDLLALMRSLLSLSDRVSWLSILRARWCGLSLKDLHSLCNEHRQSTIWELLNDKAIIQGLSNDGRELTSRFVSVMEKTLDYLPKSNFRELLEGCWTELGGPSCIEQTALNDVDVFFNKVTEVLETGNLSDLNRFESYLNNLYSEPSVGEENAVQIMTMHNAKGLEFDYVIIPGLGKKVQPDTKQLVYWMPHGDDLLLAPIQETGGDASPIYDFLKTIDKEKYNYEIKRLLYVAITRAKVQVHLFGHVNKSKEIFKPRSESLLFHLWPYLEKVWNGELARKEKNENVSPKDRLEEEKKIRIQRLPVNFQMPDPLPAIDSGSATDISIEPEERPPYEWAGNEARCLGNVLHRCFKAIADEGIENWTAQKTKQQEPAFKSALMGEGISPDSINKLFSKGKEALENILADDTGRWILKNHQEAQAERALTSVKANSFQNKIIDRTFVDNGVRWIIDYKTGEHTGSDLEKFLSEEKERYSSQLNRYEELIRLTGETRPIKKALYYPLHKRLIEI